MILFISLGVDSESEICSDVGFFGGWDDHILSRFQTVEFNVISLRPVSLFCLHRAVPLKEILLQASFWSLAEI